LGIRKKREKTTITLPTKTFRPITTTMEFECQVQAVGDGLQCRLKSHLVAKKIIVKKVFFFFVENKLLNSRVFFYVR
jgi:hypothetical protein